MLRAMLIPLLAVSAAAEPACTLYSRTIDSSELKSAADQRISNLGRIFLEEYAKHNHLEPTPAELARMRQLFDSNRAAQAEPETESARRITEQWTAATVLNFKVNRFLWKKHGGTVVLSAFGFHAATTATIREIELLERQGLLRFHEPGLREQFLAHYRNQRGDGSVQGDRAREVFAHPIWEPQ